MPVFKNIYEADRALQQILKSQPDLCAAGFRHGGLIKMDAKFFNRERAWLTLPTFILGFWLACEFLKGCRHLPRLQNKQGAHGLKHALESHYGFYISTGAVIAALIYCGFDIKRYKNCPAIDGNFPPINMPFRFEEALSCWPPEALSAGRASHHLREEGHGLQGSWEDFKRALMVEA